MAATNLLWVGSQTDIKIDSKKCYMHGMTEISGKWISRREIYLCKDINIISDVRTNL